MRSIHVFRKAKPEYKEFFERCTVVCSSPRVAFFGGEFPVLRGGVAVSQTIPLRVYVGLETVRTHAVVEFGPHVTFDGQKFTKAQLVGGGKPERQERILALIKEEFPANVGLVIHVLSECFPHGLGWAGAFSASIAGALLTHEKRLSAECVSGWPSRNVADLLRDEPFRLCFELGWHFEAALYDGKCAGVGTFSSLVGSKSPICYMTEKRSNEQAGSEPPLDVIHQKQDNYRWDGGSDTWLDGHIRYTGFRLHEVEGAASREPEFMLGIVSSGVATDTPARIDAVEKLHGQLRGVQHDLSQLIKLVEHRIPSQALEISELANHSSPLEVYYRSLSLNAAEIYRAVRLVWAAADQIEQLPVLARAMTGAHGNFMVLNLGWPQGLQILAAAMRAAQSQSIDESLIGIKPTGSGRGGFFLFVAPKARGFHAAFSRELNELKTQRHRSDLGILWDTENDATEPEGLLVEMNSPNFSECMKSHLNAVFAPRPTCVAVWKAGKKDIKWFLQRDLELIPEESNVVCVDLNPPSGRPRLIVAGRKVNHSKHKVDVKPIAAMLEALADNPAGISAESLAEVVDKKLDAKTYDADHMMSYSKDFNGLSNTAEFRSVRLQILRSDRSQLRLDPNSTAIVYAFQRRLEHIT